MDLPRKKMELDADNNIMKCTVPSEKSAYLLGMIENKGIQIFRFKISNMKLTLWRQTIGLWKINNEEEEPPFQEIFVSFGKDLLALQIQGILLLVVVIAQLPIMAVQDLQQDVLWI